VQSAARDIEQSVTNAAHEMETGVRSVETQLNEAGTAAPAPDIPASQPSAGETPSKTDAAGGTSAPPEAPQQPSLPGLERI
jgi:hypothetical protein